MSIGRTYSLALVLASPSLETIRDSDHWEYDSLVGLVWDGRPPGMVVLCVGRTVDVHDSLGNGLCQWILLCLDSNRRCLMNYVPIYYSHTIGREWRKRILHKFLERETMTVVVVVLVWDDAGYKRFNGRMMNVTIIMSLSPPSNLMLYTTGTTSSSRTSFSMNG